MRSENRAREEILNSAFITSYERDNESELDFAQARYFSSGFGRFTGPDPLMASMRKSNPQTFNRYVYVGNNPTNIIDPLGLDWLRSNERGENGNYTYTDVYGKELKTLLKGNQYQRVDFNGSASSDIFNKDGVAIFRMFAKGGGEDIKTPSGPDGIRTLINSTNAATDQKLPVVLAAAGGSALVGATGGGALALAPGLLAPTVTTLGLTTEAAVGTATTVAAAAAANPDKTAQVLEAVGATVSRTESVLGHIFRDSAGHVNPATGASQGRFINLFERVANNPDNLNPNVLSTFQRANTGFQGFSQTFRQGQVWTQVYNGRVINAGVNTTPK